MTIYYSCDSHVVEPAEVFEGLEKDFGSRAPQVVRNDRGERTAVTLGRFPVPVGRFGIAGHRLDDPATDELIRRGYEGLNQGVFDPADRLKEQEQDGIVGEVMYPSINMVTFSLPDREVAHAVFRRHNDWIRDYCSEDPERLIGVACLPLPDVEEAVAELERVAAMGVRGAAIPCTDPADKPYFHPDYERFWSAAEDAGLPITMHIFTGTTWEIGVRTRDVIGIDNMLWGNDYPHHDSIWPRSMEVIDRIFSGVPRDEKEKMTSGNVLGLYGIRREALPGAAS